jgi:Phage P22-like portal protein
MSSARDEKLLKEIRENHDYALDAWREIREEAKTDMRFIAGEHWPEAEKKAREDANRPCISLDELNQYCSQLINDVRMNKRAVKAIPEGNGATDETAEFRANLIRNIEYKSKAQAAYTCAFENAAQRSYGFAGLSKRWVPGEFHQELIIRRFPNPDAVLIDPDFKEADASDIGFGYVLDAMRPAAFKKKWPKAEVTSFTSEHMQAAPAWISETNIQVAEYWKREAIKRELLLIDDGSPQGLKIHQDELPEGAALQDSSVILPGVGARPLKSSRTEDDWKVCQYLTNGIEVLETNPWDGIYIPIGCCFGKELFVDDGAGSKRILSSLIRRARGAQTLYSYYRTAELELAGMVPKTPAIGYEGQFENHEADWQNAHRVPIGYLEAKAVTDATGQAILPLPQYNRWEPPIQALEMGAESARRAIQAAVGMYNTSVGKHDTNAQSGVAIDKLDRQSSQGSFHFIDNFDGFLEHMGRMLDDLIDKTYDTARDVGTIKANDEHQLVHINEPVTDPKTGEVTHIRTDVGDHGITITTGPSSDSQRDAAEQFTESLAQNEAIFPRIADLVVKLRNLGPIGDEIAKRLVPPDIAQQEQGQQQIPPQFLQQYQALAQQHQVLLQHVQAMSEEIKTKSAELEVKKYTVDQQEETKRTIAFATINAQQGAELLRQEIAAATTKINQVHEALLQQQQHAHEADQAQQQQQAAQEQQAQGAQQQQAAQAQAAQQQPAA